MRRKGHALTGEASFGGGESRHRQPVFGSSVTRTIINAYRLR